MGFFDKAKGKLGVLPSSRQEVIKEHLREGVARWRSLPAWKKEEIKEGVKSRVKAGIAKWKSLPDWKKNEIKARLRERVDEVLE